MTREDIPTVRGNGCWTIDGEYVGWGRNIFIPSDKTLYCFCDERDGCNDALKRRIPLSVLILSLVSLLVSAKMLN